MIIEQYFEKRKKCGIFQLSSLLCTALHARLAVTSQNDTNLVGPQHGKLQEQ